MSVQYPVAIIGMGCLFPKSADLKNYWQLLYHGKDAITDVPVSHWSPSEYFDPDPKSPDRVYCKRGGFLSPVSFDPTEFGIPPAALEATDTSQLLGLLAAKMALDDCGYGETRDFDRDRASVILGVTGTQELVIPLSSRLGHPKWRRALEEAAIPEDKTDEVIKRISDSYIPWQENSFPGLLGNVVAGRICNRLDLRGTNCVVDAACASSMSAIHLSILELQSGRSDMVVTGGVDTLNDIFMHMCFSKTHTLSATGDARPFSEDADGTVLGEGIGILVLKRLKEAQSDNDRIYAVIKGLGSSSDGKSQSIYSPRVEGQAKALRAAYKNAGINPDTVGMIEAHGTGTRVGDKVEFEALNKVFEEFSANGHKCALGSVKSMIGHTKAAAGAAGLIKTALSLHHKVLPATLKAEKQDPNLDIENSHFYLNTSTRPWIPKSGHPRRAGVSAFGFGGSNFHVVLEEHDAAKTEISWDGSVEIFAFSAAQRQEVFQTVRRYRDLIAKGLSDREFGIKAAESRRDFSCAHARRLLIVSEAETNTADLFDHALKALDSGSWPENSGSRNVYLGGPEKPGKLAFLFPGQGSQYVEMGRDLICKFPEAMQILEDANKKFVGPAPLSDLIFPPNIHADQSIKQAETILRRTDIAQPAIGAVSLAMLKVIRSFGVHPDATCGHSFGELTALHAADWIDEETLLSLSITRGQLMAAAGGNQESDAGAMLAVQAPLDELQELVGRSNLPIIIANRNTPNQGVLSGPTTAIAEFQQICQNNKIKAIRLPVSAAFHSDQVKNACQPFLHALNRVQITPTAIDVYSNTTGEPYPADAEPARNLLGHQLRHPVEFVTEIINIFNSGVRTFVEIGPKAILSGLVSAILQNKDFKTLAIDASAGKTNGIADLARLLSRLSALGCTVDLPSWENPHSSVRKPRMNILLHGSNYTMEKIQIPPKKLEAGQKKHMNKNSNQKQNLIEDALKVVQEGLKSMQHLHSQTTLTHQKFLEAQTEANRSLQEMMRSAQRLTEKSLGLYPQPPETARAMPHQLESAHAQNYQRPEDTPSAIRHTDHALNTATPLPDFDVPAHPPIQNVPEGAANGYSHDGDEHNFDTEPHRQDKLDCREVESEILQIVSHLTGYPQEMLGLDMDIEAELGIDSIKRVEILSTLEEKMPDLPSVSPEIMGTLKTLGQIVEYLSRSDDGQSRQQSSGTHKSDEEFAATEKNTDAVECRQNEITTTLLQIVSNLTGYPQEMLGLDMDIEAELGIDSIKRVEILSTLEEKMPDLPTVSPEIMGTLKTLGQIAEYLSDAPTTGIVQPQTVEPHPLNLSQPVREERNTSDDANQHVSDTDIPQIPRNKVSVVDAPALANNPIRVAANKKVFVTEDNTGLAEQITEALEKKGINTIRISLDILKFKKQLPDAAGLVIVQDPKSQNMDRDLKEAFNLTKYLAPDLIDSAKNGGALFAAITRLDGAFGFKRQIIHNPEQGGLAGLVKTAAIEWQDVCCHTIDIAPGWSDNHAIADTVVKEIMLPGPIEIGLDANRRSILTLEPRSLPTGRINLVKDDVIVVSGGARGITAATALELARQAGSRLILLGRSPQPVVEPDWLPATDDEAAIKKAIIENEFDKERATPADIENAFKKHKANREIAANLDRLRSAGSDAHYYSADIRDSESVLALMKDIRMNHGPITGVIHGAGVLEDRLIVDKTGDQFDRVFDTKVAGFKNLLSATRTDPLKYLVIFSSVAARTGNKGQADYAMANEVLNKMAQVESTRRTDCRVVAINWGPWNGGMVTPALKREFERNGIRLIPAEDGVKCMLLEMMSGNNDAAEVVIGTGLNDTIEKGSHEVRKPALVKSPPVVKKRPLTPAFERQIDIQNYPVLQSHVIDGRPVVPLALMTEWFAHGALHGNPGLVLTGLEDIRVLKGIRLLAEKIQIRLLTGRLNKSGEHFEVELELRSGENHGQEIIHSRARAVLNDRWLPSPANQFSKAMVAKAYTRHMTEVYDKILFHGEQLHGIRKIISCSSRGMVAHISPAPKPKEWISQPLRNQWIADPLVLDSAFQMATVWCFEEKGVVSLPSYIASYRQYRSQFPSDSVTAVLEIKDSTKRKVKGDITLLDTNDEVIARLTGYEAIMDPSLRKAFKPQYRASA